jgi:hypothetical protein
MLADAPPVSSAVVSVSNFRVVLPSARWSSRGLCSLLSHSGVAASRLFQTSVCVLLSRSWCFARFVLMHLRLILLQDAFVVLIRSLACVSFNMQEEAGGEGDNGDEGDLEDGNGGNQGEDGERETLHCLLSVRLCHDLLSLPKPVCSSLLYFRLVSVSTPAVFALFWELREVSAPVRRGSACCAVCIVLGAS